MLAVWKLLRRLPGADRVRPTVREDGHRMRVRAFSYDDLLTVSDDYESCVAGIMPPEGGVAIDADHVLLALPASRAALIVKQADAALSDLLGAVPYAGVAMVALAYRVADVGRSLDGYGYLVDRNEGLDTLGVLWESSLFDGRAPEGFALLRVMMGGLRHPDVLSRDEPALIQRARAPSWRVR
jgi:protoporphyrinogen oxidase